MGGGLDVLETQPKELPSKIRLEALGGSMGLGHLGCLQRSGATSIEEQQQPLAAGWTARTGARPSDERQRIRFRMKTLAGHTPIRGIFRDTVRRRCATRLAVLLRLLDPSDDIRAPPTQRSAPPAAAVAMSGCCPCASSSSSSPLFLLPCIPAACRSSGRVSFSLGGAACRPAASVSLRRGARPRRGHVIVAASSKDGAEKEDDDPAFNPFGFVTDNPSSRSAIQLPAVPAEDGNVGQMLYRIEDKGREFGSYVRSGEFRWFVRETGSSDAQRGTIVFIHGAPTQSFSYRTVMSQMADAGYHCYAPDWIGFGFSEMPQPGYGFDYTEEEFHKAFDDLLDTLNISEPFFLVVQGFIVGSYGLTWALKNSSKVLKVAILNTPLTVSSPLPGLFQQLRWPLLGEFTCQNAVSAERFIEAGSAYVLKLEKADVYRLPYLSSGAPGFALLEAARKAKLQDVLSRISGGFSSNSWEKPILLAWGLSDKYLPLSIAEEFKKGNPDVVKLEPIEGAGHMPQEAREGCEGPDILPVNIDKTIYKGTDKVPGFGRA
ncbi:hypothetical protein ACP70R_010851 [Stipagrostis hirtigluma subsp. patula]